MKESFGEQGWTGWFALASRFDLATQYAGADRDGNFPHVRIGDDVRAQHKFVAEKQFGLTSFALIVGGSMGAQQTYEWAVRYPRW